MSPRMPLIVAGTLLTALAASGAIGTVLDGWDPLPSVEAACDPNCPQSCDYSENAMCGTVDEWIHQLFHPPEPHLL